MRGIVEGAAGSRGGFPIVVDQRTKMPSTDKQDHAEDERLTFRSIRPFLTLKDYRRAIGHVGAGAVIGVIVAAVSLVFGAIGDITGLERFSAGHPVIWWLLIGLFLLWMARGTKGNIAGIITLEVHEFSIQDLLKVILLYSLILVPLLILPPYVAPYVTAVWLFVVIGAASGYNALLQRGADKRQHLVKGQ